MPKQRGRRKQVWRENPRADGDMALEHSTCDNSASDEEMAGAAVSASKNQNKISNYSKEELTGILDLI